MKGRYIMLGLLTAAVLASLLPPSPISALEGHDPTVNVSAIRSIVCNDELGTGFLVGPKTMVTALHVVKGQSGCVDADTKSPIKVYAIDLRHDLAMVTAAGLPTNMPYIKLSCGRFQKNEAYLSYGRTSFERDWADTIIRTEVLYGTGEHMGKDDELDDGTSMEGLARLSGMIVPGDSGGPIVNLKGYALSFNDAGNSSDDAFGYEFADTFICKR